MSQRHKGGVVIDVERWQRDVRPFGDQRDIGEALRGKAGAGFVKHHSQRVKVRRGRTRPFRRNIAFGPDKGSSLAIPCDQADISQFRPAVDINDVSGFNVAVDQSVPMELRQPTGNIDGQAQAIRSRQPA